MLPDADILHKKYVMLVQWDIAELMLPFDEIKMKMYAHSFKDILDKFKQDSTVMFSNVY